MASGGESEYPRQIRHRLATWLATVATESEANAVRVHLADLCLASARLEKTIAGLPALDVQRDRAEIRRQLTDLHVQLYSHILPHLEHLRPGLEQLTERLYSELPEAES